MRHLFRFETFERVSAALLLIAMGAVILLSLLHVAVGIFEFGRDYTPDLDYSAFQDIFDRVLASVIALELARSVFAMVRGRHGVVQVRIVVLIGILAVVRKLILLEIETTSGVYLLGLSAAILALGGVYALLYWAEVRLRPDHSPLENGDFRHEQAA